jgi:uncharacterized protein with PQ loop repeat
MELALFTLMYGVFVTVLTNINDTIDICRGEDLFSFYAGTEEIYDMLRRNKRHPTIGCNVIFMMFICVLICMWV